MEPVITEDLVKFGEDRGEARGEARGQLAVLTRQVGRRLGRVLTDAEVATLQQRLAA